MWSLIGFLEVPMCNWHRTGWNFASGQMRPVFSFRPMTKKMFDHYLAPLPNGAWHWAFMFLFAFGSFCGKGIAKRLNSAFFSHPS
jgi:hypothetical protein